MVMPIGAAGRIRRPKITHPASYFGFHSEAGPYFQSFDEPNCFPGYACFSPTGIYRIWDIWGDWNGAGVSNSSWSEINTSSGVYNWADLDDYIDWLMAHGVQPGNIMYVFGSTPDWTHPGTTGDDTIPPDNLSVGATFASAVATRYLNRIKIYGLYNEPNGRWAGPDYTKLANMCGPMYDAIKAVDPTATVLSPEFQGGEMTDAATYFAAGTSNNGKKFDVFAWHPYGDSTGGTSYDGVSNSVAQFNGYRTNLNAAGLTSKKIWHTEYGRESFRPVLNDPNVDDYMAKRYLVDAGLRVPRGCHYAYDDSETGTIRIDPGGSLASSATVHNEVASWLIGKVVGPGVTTVTGTTREVQIKGAGGYQAVAVWKDGTTSGTYTVTAGKYVNRRNPDGTNSAIAGGTTSITIGNTPCLLETATTTSAAFYSARATSPTRLCTPSAWAAVSGTGSTTNPRYMFVDDTRSATITPPVSSASGRVVDVYTFGVSKFDIPDSKTISKVEFTVKWNISASNASRNLGLRAVMNGTQTAQTTFVPGSNAARTDVWDATSAINTTLGRSVVPTDLRDGIFSLRLQATNSTATSTQWLIQNVAVQITFT